MRPLVGHTKDVRAVAYLPDGRLVSGGGDRTVRVWNPQTGELLLTRKAGTPIYAVAASPDGRQIAYAGRHPGATAAATPVFTYLLHDDVPGYTFRYPLGPPPVGNEYRYPAGTAPRSVWALAYAPDGRTLAAVGRVMGGGNIPNGGGGHWFRTGDASAHGPLADGRAYALAFAADGRLAVTGDAVVGFYANPEAPAPVAQSPLKSDWAAAVAFVPGTPTAVVGASSWLYFVNATRPERPRTVKTGFLNVTGIAAPADGRVVYVGGRPSGVEVYEAGSAKQVARYDFGLGGVNAVAVSPDGLTVAAGGDDGLAVIDREA